MLVVSLSKLALQALHGYSLQNDCSRGPSKKTAEDLRSGWEGSVRGFTDRTVGCPNHSQSFHGHAAVHVSVRSRHFLHVEIGEADAHQYGGDRDT